MPDVYIYLTMEKKSGSNPAEVAWAAGLFDGEGGVCKQGGGSLMLKMVDGETVERFADAVGIGTLYGPYENGSAERRDGYARSTFFLWRANRAEAEVVAALLYPLLSPIRRRAIDAYGLHRFAVETIRPGWRDMRKTAWVTSYRGKSAAA